jgi:23S rRNA pseudouridine1911/1915/1917 synthase
VHLAHAGHPLVGDPLYLRRLPASAKSLPPGVAAALTGFPRQALHAAVLGFTHPVTGEALRFETPLPPDMGGLVTTLWPDWDGAIPTNPV